MKASRRLGICSLSVALLTPSAGAETRIYAALANNYVYRGTSSSDDKASASLGLDWDSISGVYAGTNVSSLHRGVELDAYAGYAHAFGTFALDVGANAYRYTSDWYVDGSFRELYVGGQAGPVGLSVYRGDSPFGYRYWYGDLYAGVPAGPVVVELHYGLADYGAGARVSDEFVGFTARWHGLDWRLRLTHHEGEDDVKFVAAISKTWTVSR